jgi:putative transposase
MGIDLGLQNFLTTSDGFTLEAPNFLKTLQSKLKSLQRRVARKKKHSKNLEKAQVEVARLHHHIANTRKNFHFQVAHQLCDQADLVFVEEIDFRISAKGFFYGAYRVPK